MNAVAVIPAHNEAERIEATVRAAAGIEGVTRVLVVDDASGDDTAALAEAAGAEVVRLENNLGKGGALDAGLARVGDADVVLLLDGDLADTAGQGALLLAPIAAGEVDMTIAGFPRPANKAGFGLVKGLARAGIARLGNAGFEANSPLSGQRALTREALKAAGTMARGYGVEVALTVRVLRAGLRVVEVPTTMTHAATGRDVAGFKHRGRQFLDVARTLAALAFERRGR